MNTPTAEPRVTPALATGFAAAVACWVVWFVTHMPAVAAPSGVTMPLLILTLAGAVACGARRSARPVRTGAWAGLVSALVNLMLLGSKLVEQPASVDQMSDDANRFNPDAPWMMLGFVVFSVAVGAVAGWLSTRLPKREPLDARSWLARFGVVAAVAFAPLLVVGGAVTSTESGMAVPDGVTSYGALSVLFPFSLMAEPRIFLEHTHRLFGTLVGLTTMVWMVLVLAGGVRTKLKVLAVVVFLGVCAQGVFGIIRVDQNLTWVAAGHGVFAQVVLALAAALAALLTPLATGVEPEEQSHGARTASRLGVGTLVCLFIQLSFGALYRHTGMSHALWSHVGFSVITAAAVIVLGIGCHGVHGSRAIDAALRRIGWWLIGILSAQFALGIAALALVAGQDHRAVPTAEELAVAQSVPPLEALVTTAHQATGAGLAAAAAVATVWAYVARRGEKKRANPAVDPDAALAEQGAGADAV